MPESDWPARFAGMDVYGGMPVPHNVKWTNGVPDFRVLDEEKVVASLRDRLCAVCGKGLGYWIAFIGSPKSIESRFFLDGPMHEECARWSAQHCPFLAGEREYSDLEKRPPKAEGVFTEPTQTERPDRIGMFITRGWKVAQHGPMTGIKADPAKRIEWLHESPSQRSESSAPGATTSSPPISSPSSESSTPA